MRYDYPDRAPFPGLTRMQHEGLRAERLIAGWPSSTFPGHVTLATGAWAGTHGIVDNEFLDRVRGRYAYSSDASWLEAEPLWIAAERQGVKAATYFWVGSETDWHDQRQHYRIAPFDADVPESAKVDQMLAWIDLPADQRPGLIMAYWHGADSVGHRRGPDHPDVVKQIYDQDAQLVRLLDGLDARHLWDDTTVLLVSDHGMVALHEFLRPARLPHRARFSGARLRRPGRRARLPGRSEADRRRLCTVVSAEAVRGLPRRRFAGAVSSQTPDAHRRSRRRQRSDGAADVP